MGSVSVTYTENIESSYKATWTYTLSASDILVTGNKFIVPNGIVTSKYVYSGKARAESDITYSPRINGVTQSREFYKANTASGASDVSWSSNSPKTLANVSGYPTSLEVDTSTFFNANNKTIRTIPLTYYIRNVWAYSQKNTSGDKGNGIDQSKSTVKTTGTVANITLNVPPTATVSALTTDTPYIYTGLTTASVTVSDSTAYYGGDVTDVTLTIGNQSTSLSGDGTLSIALDMAGTFTPTVTVTDSRGQTKSYPLDPITVNSYTAPSVSFDVDRTNSSGQLDDEGTYCLITATLTFSDVIASALAPSVVATDENGTQTTPTVNWYTDNALTTAVTWANVSSGDTVYGIFSGVNTQYSYQVSVRPRDSEGTGNAIVQTLPSAFYTVDFLAGGHGIAFGQPATQDGFFCNMQASFVDANDVMRALFDFIHPVGSYYETSDVTFDPNVTWGGTWVLESNGESNITDSGWLTLVNTNGTIIYRKIGKTVFVNGYGVRITHNVIRATLPEGYRPDQRTAAAGSFPLTKQTYANIETDGTINPIINGGGTESNWYFQAVFSTGAGESSGVNRWHRTA